MIYNKTYGKGGEPLAEGEKTLMLNRRVRHEYFIDETYEAGIELKGTEVKSIRLGKLNFKDGYCYIKQGELWLTGVHVSPYEKGNIFNVEPERTRRLLMHKREIRRLYDQVRLNGVSIVPLRVYLKKGRVKLEIAVVRGKKLYDKRDAAAKRSAKLDMARAQARE